jgi:hypothetical protein
VLVGLTIRIKVDAQIAYVVLVFIIEMLAYNVATGHYYTASPLLPACLGMIQAKRGAESLGWVQDPARLPNDSKGKWSTGCNFDCCCILTTLLWPIRKAESQEKSDIRLPESHISHFVPFNGTNGAGCAYRKGIEDARRFGCQ